MARGGNTYYHGCRMSSGGGIRTSIKGDRQKMSRHPGEDLKLLERAVGGHADPLKGKNPFAGAGEPSSILFRSPYPNGRKPEAQTGTETLGLEAALKSRSQAASVKRSFRGEGGKNLRDLKKNICNLEGAD